MLAIVRMLLISSSLLTVWSPVLSAVPGSTSAINTDAGGLALRGYDPVAYFDGGKPVKGQAKYSAAFNGSQYWFISAQHRQAFLKEPIRYIPQFGGFCTVGASYGQKVDADPSTGRVVNGKLYVNYNMKAQAIFDKDPLDSIKRAEEKWPSVKDQVFTK
jgi:YHS domain-containing protein